MGNLCGKESKDKGNFAGPGRTLGTAPPRSENARSTIPAAAKPAPAGRTLGGGAAAGASQGQSEEDARSAAAKAAEERANKTSGKLGKALEEQKRKTDRQVLMDVSNERRAQRDADAATEARNWN